MTVITGNRFIPKIRHIDHGKHHGGKLQFVYLHVYRQNVDTDTIIIETRQTLSAHCTRSTSIDFVRLLAVITAESCVVCHRSNTSDTDRPNVSSYFIV